MDKVPSNRAESLREFIADLSDPTFSSKVLESWMRGELGEDLSVAETEVDRASDVRKDINDSGSAGISHLLQLESAYGPGSEHTSDLTLLRFQSGPACICREPGWKTDEVWGSWDIVAIVLDPESPASFGEAFLTICGDEGRESVMNTIPRMMTNYRPTMLLRSDVREGLLRQAHYSEYWGHGWTGDGTVADAFDATFLESDDDLQQRRRLIEGGVTADAVFDDLTHQQQLVVIDVLMHYCYSEDG